MLMFALVRLIERNGYHSERSLRTMILKKEVLHYPLINKYLITVNN